MLVARQIQYRPCPLVLPRPTDARQREAGIARLVEPMALAATACGADGLIIEVHNDPMHALCDGAQSLRPEVYDDLAKKVRSIREVIAK